MTVKFKTNLKHTTALVDLTPLVDVIFLLLIFFIVTSDILPLKSLNIENPQIDRSSLPLMTQMPIMMDAQHVIYVGSKKRIAEFSVIKNMIQEELEMIKRQHPGANPSVVLSVDRRVEYEYFLRLFSIVQECSPRIRLVYEPSGDLNA